MTVTFRPKDSSQVTPSSPCFVISHTDQHPGPTLDEQSFTFHTTDRSPPLFYSLGTHKHTGMMSVPLLGLSLVTNPYSHTEGVLRSLSFRSFKETLNTFLSSISFHLHKGTVVNLLIRHTHSLYPHFQG